MKLKCSTGTFSDNKNTVPKVSLDWDQKFLRKSQQGLAHKKVCPIISQWQNKIIALIDTLTDEILPNVNSITFNRPEGAR